MIPVGNSQYQKIANTCLILNLLRKGPMSRIEISDTLGLQASTVTYSTQRLIEQGVINECGVLESSGKGRKQKALSLNLDRGLVAGIELLVGFYRLSLLDILGRVRLKIELSYTVSYYEKGPELYKMRLSEALEKAEALASPLSLLGVCIAIPGVVYPDPFTVEDCWTHGLKNASFASFLSKYPYPVFLENDANCSALRFLLEGNPFDDFIYILFRKHDAVDLPSNVPLIGIGSGLVISGKLYKGAHGRAGEFASNMIDEIGHQVSLSNADLSALESNKEAVKSLIREVFSNYLSSSCLIDPSCIYIGGFLADDPFRSILQEIVDNEYKSRFGALLPYTRLQISENSSYDPSMGAACYILDWLFRVPQVGITEEDERRFAIIGMD